VAGGVIYNVRVTVTTEGREREEVGIRGNNYVGGIVEE
jgi:hypothetical protein